MSPRAAKPNAMSGTVTSAAVLARKRLVLSEHEHQVALFAWMNAMKAVYPELELGFAIPNYARVSPRWGAYMKAEGKRAGVPDIVLPVSAGGHNALYLELKVKPNTVSPEQAVWHARLRLYRNRVEVCWSWEEARDVILRYLSDR